MFPDLLSIGNLKLATPLLLAPMAGYTDYAFRPGIRALGGIGLAFTEMINPRSAMSGGGLKREALLAHGPGDDPLGWQIYGSDPSLMADCAQYLCETHHAQLIDINMGCPQRKIAGRGEGAALLKNPHLAGRVAAAVTAAVAVPVTVKMRIGWDANTPVAADLARACAAQGVSAVIVHGRTGVQKYTGTADHAAIREVVRAVDGIPVIGNGDITNPADARKMLENTGCSGLMIGRTALRHPWIFKQTMEYLENQYVITEVTRQTRLDFMLAHLQRISDLYGHENAAKLFRKWIPPQAASLGINKPAMVKLLEIRRTDALHAALKSAVR